jgi:hypothetical protein
MRTQDLLAANLQRGLNFIQMTVADLSDADLLVRPCPAANHANWQLGHLAGADVWFVTTCGGPAAELPAGWMEKFSNKAHAVDDPAKLATKAELLAALAKARAVTVEWVKGLSDADMAKASPQQLASFAPTIADVPLALGEHGAMHLGQIQAIRRKLGKPILF